MKRTHDRVVVAGGGPVGALAALLLARAGIPVTLLERERKRNLERMAATAADAKLAYEYMLEASMLASLRRCGMLPG